MKGGLQPRKTRLLQVDALLVLPRLSPPFSSLRVAQVLLAPLPFPSDGAASRSGDGRGGRVTVQGSIMLALVVGLATWATGAMPWSRFMPWRSSAPLLPSGVRWWPSTSLSSRLCPWGVEVDGGGSGDGYKDKLVRALDIKVGGAAPPLSHCHRGGETGEDSGSTSRPCGSGEPRDLLLASVFPRYHLLPPRRPPLPELQIKQSMVSSKRFGWLVAMLASNGFASKSQRHRLQPPAARPFSPCAVQARLWLEMVAKASTARSPEDSGGLNCVLVYSSGDLNVKREDMVVIFFVFAVFFAML